jgi:GxxExxY protein
MPQLIHPELSYAVRGVLLNVYNSLGPMLKEKFYEQAIAIGLEKRGLRCETQKKFEVYYEGEQVGFYFVDVWIEGGKILLELKVAPQIEPFHRGQAIAYLKVTDADLAIVANFGGSSLQDERLPNFVRDRQVEFIWQTQPSAEDWLYPDLAEQILRACHRVHFILGPGFLHQVYRRAAMVELRRSQLNYRYIKHLPVQYDGQVLGEQEARLILVEDKVLLVVYALRDADESLAEQLKTRLRRLDVRLGLLANFHDTRLSVTPVRRK